MLFRKAAALPEAFPIRSFRVGVLVMIGFIVALVLLAYRLEQNIRTAMDQQLMLTKAAAETEHFGSSRGFAIRAVVSTGDPAAAARYRSIQPWPRRAIAELRTHIDDDHVYEVAMRVNRYDRRLVRQELEALRLAQNGDLRRAQAIIDDPEYQRLAQSFFDGVYSIQAHAHQHVRELQTRIDVRLWVLLGISGASVLLIAIAWMSFVRPAGRWGEELHLARTKAENMAAQLQRSQRELAAKNRQLFHQARVDALTGLHTRLQLNEDMGNPWASAGAAQQPWHALLCDVDSFRRYNQAHGHVAGDRVLQSVAQAFQLTGRAAEQLYRLGGDQFLILTKGKSSAAVMARAERFRLAIEQMLMAHETSPHQLVTVSVGVAQVDANGEAHMERWLTRARDALAEAKVAGRNRVRQARGRLAHAS